MKTKVLILVFLSIFFNIQGQQKVYEYDIVENLNFQTYSDSENKLYKVDQENDFKQSTPEQVAQAYFFGTSNEVLSKLYLNNSKFQPKEQTNFNVIKETPKEDVYIQLLHKTNYKFENNQMVYLMFIAKVKGIKFSFPTLLSLIKKNSKWLIHQRANQQKTTDCLMMFKPCVLSNLIEGKSSNTNIKQLINLTKGNAGNLDFIKLYDELVKISNDEKKSTELTMAENMICDVKYKKQLNGKVNFTGVFEKIDVKNYTLEDQKKNAKFINLIKQNNDSIFITQKIDVKYSDKVFSALKYKAINKGIEKPMFSKIDQNEINNYIPVKNLFFLYEKLDSKIFDELTPTIDAEKNKKLENNPLYKKTRGTFNVLNISKLYNLYQKDKNLFKEYIYK